MEIRSLFVGVHGERLVHEERVVTAHIAHLVARHREASIALDAVLLVAGNVEAAVASDAELVAPDLCPRIAAHRRAAVVEHLDALVALRMQVHLLLVLLVLEAQLVEAASTGRAQGFRTALWVLRWATRAGGMLTALGRQPATKGRSGSP